MFAPFRLSNLEFNVLTYLCLTSILSLAATQTPFSLCTNRISMRVLELSLRNQAHDLLNSTKVLSLLIITLNLLGSNFYWVLTYFFSYSSFAANDKKLKKNWSTIKINCNIAFDTLQKQVPNWTLKIKANESAGCTLTLHRTCRSAHQEKTLLRKKMKKRSAWLRDSTLRYFHWSISRYRARAKLRWSTTNNLYRHT